MSVHTAAKQYFEAFNAHDCKALEALFDPDVTLTDWELALSGREAVVRQMGELFAAAPDINAEVKDLIVDGDRAAAELVVTLEGVPPIRVVDILRFGGEGRIVSVTAYKI